MVVFSQDEQVLGAVLDIEEAEQPVAPWFSIPYPEQLERKEESLRECLGPAYKTCIQPILPSPEVLRHRNKMEFSFGFDQDDSRALGFHQRGKFWRVRDLNRSVFLTEAGNRVYSEVKRWAFETGLPFYRQVDNQGFFRYLVIREGKRTGEVLVNLVVNPTAFGAEIERVKSDLRDLAGRCSDVTSLWLTFRRAVGDAALGEKTELLAGPPFIQEKLLDLTFQVSPTSFFQVNTAGAETLYRTLRRLIGDIGPCRTCVDLYCGSGGIALAVSGQFAKISGIDSDEESIRLAVENARINQIHNCTFVCARARRARDLVTTPVDVLAVDPPRAGLAPKAVRTLLRLGPEHLVYISCNPRSFQENMRMLDQHFRVHRIIPIDLFPHTPHIELIALLESVRRAQ